MSNILKDREFDLDLTHDYTNIDMKDKYKNDLYDVFGNIDYNILAKELHGDITEPFDEVKENYKLKKDIVTRYTESIVEDAKIKKGYAITLLVSYFVELIIFNGIFISVGLGLIYYSEVALDIFVAGSIIELVSLMKIIVSSLFDDRMVKTINSIFLRDRENRV